MTLLWKIGIVRVETVLRSGFGKGLWIREGSILEVTYISPEGEKLTTNIKVQASDLELLRELSGGN